MKSKKKRLTLIELLVVIVIRAVIALIFTSLIIGMIEKTEGGTLLIMDNNKKYA